MLLSADSPQTYKLHYFEESNGQQSYTSSRLCSLMSPLQWTFSSTLTFLLFIKTFIFLFLFLNLFHFIYAYFNHHSSTFSLLLEHYPPFLFPFSYLTLLCIFFSCLCPLLSFTSFIQNYKFYSKCFSSL